MDELQAQVQNDISENANSVEFVEDKADVVDTTAAEANEKQADSTLPPLMQAE